MTRNCIGKVKNSSNNIPATKFLKTKTDNSCNRAILFVNVHQVLQQLGNHQPVMVVNLLCVYSTARYGSSLLLEPLWPEQSWSWVPNWIKYLLSSSETIQANPTELIMVRNTIRKRNVARRAENENCEEGSFRQRISNDNVNCSQLKSFNKAI